MTLVACQSQPPAIPPTTFVTALNPPNYELVVARDNNIVLVLESSAPSDRPHVRVEIALQSALQGQRGRCEPSGCSAGTAVDGPSLFTLVSDPALTESDLRQFEDLSVMMSGSGTWSRTEASSDAIPRLTDCLVDLASLDAGVLVATGFVATDLRASPQLSVEATIPNANLNEFVLSFESPAAAAEAYTTIRDGALNCPTRSNYEIHPMAPELTPDTPAGWPYETAFFVEFSRSG